MPPVSLSLQTSPGKVDSIYNGNIVFVYDRRADGFIAQNNGYIGCAASLFGAP